MGADPETSIKQLSETLAEILFLKFQAFENRNIELVV